MDIAFTVEMHYTMMITVTRLPTTIRAKIITNSQQHIINKHRNRTQTAPSTYNMRNKPISNNVVCVFINTLLSGSSQVKQIIINI